MHPSDDEAAIALLRPLDTDPVAPSTVDVERAVREGRRRRRRVKAARSVALVAAAGLLVVVGTATVTRLRGVERTDPNATAPSAGAAASAGATRRPPMPGDPPAAPTRCVVSTLPIPDGVKKGIVTGADPTGRVVLGRSYLADGDKQVLLWRDGKVQKVPMVGGDPGLDDINSAGTAVGVEYGDAGASPVAFSGGSVTKLATGDLIGGEATAINEAGTIVGAVGPTRTLEQPVRWAGPNSRPETLPVGGYGSGHATDIDEDGTVVGWVGDQLMPYVWFPDGGHRGLPVPTLDGVAAANSDARSIRNGWVVGMARYMIGGTMQTRAMRWNLYTGEAAVFPEFNGTASAVNRYGWQVGPALTPTGLLRTPTGTVNLPGLPLGGEAHSLSVIPKSISDDGRTMAGQSDDSTNTLRPVVWRCT